MDRDDDDLILFATKEGRELQRIRDSVTFNIGIEVVKIFRNPLKILFTPFNVFRTFRKRSTTDLSFDFEPKNDYLIVGIDKTGQFYSNRAIDLAHRLDQVSRSQVTVISNSVVGPKESNNTQWFRLPAAREHSYSRKEWNITMERLLSTAISLSRPRTIIYFGDYLYRGVINSFEPLPDKIHTIWMYSEYPKDSHLDISKIPKVKKICVPAPAATERSLSGLPSLDSTNAGCIFFTDISKSNHSVFQALTKTVKGDFFAIQRQESVHSTVKRTFSISDICSATGGPNHFFMIDETSKLLPFLPLVPMPGILLIGSKVESPVLRAMIDDLELHHGLVVVRRSQQVDLIESIRYLMNRDFVFAEKSPIDDYTVNWLQSQGID